MAKRQHRQHVQQPLRQHQASAQWQLDLGHYPHRKAGVHANLEESDEALAKAIEAERCEEHVQDKLSFVPAAVLQKYRMRRDTGQGLRELWLTRQNLSMLSRQVGSLLNLRTLGLGGNMLGSVPTQVCALARLERLDLSGNQLSDLPAEMSRLSALTELRLDRNRFQALPECVSGLRNLKLLSASRNALRSLPGQALRKMRRLVELDLDDNALDADALLSVPWGELSRGLQVVGLAGSSLRHEQVPSQLLQLPDLETLRFGSKQYQPHKYLS